MFGKFKDKGLMKRLRRLKTVLPFISLFTQCHTFSLTILHSNKIACKKKAGNLK